MTVPPSMYGAMSDVDAATLQVGAPRPGAAGKVAGAARFFRDVWAHPSNRDERVRQTGRAALFQARARLLRRDTVVPLGEHSRIVASLGRASSIQLAIANPPDPGEWAVWRRFLRQGDTFLDVGANVGSYTILACAR